MPYIGRTLGQGTRSRFLYTATAGQTTFSGSDSQSNTLAYADNNGLDCFQNGVLLKGGGADYTATTGTSVVLTTGASVSDVIEILVYDVFAIADHVKKSGDAMTGALTNIDVNGTELILDADADTSITADTDDQVDIKVGGSDKVTITTTGLGIGTTSPDSVVNIEATKTNALSSEAHFTTLGLCIDDNTAYNTALAGGGIAFRHIKNSSGDMNVYGAIDGVRIDNANGRVGGHLRFFTNNDGDGIPKERMRIDSSGTLLIGRTADVSSDTNLGIEVTDARKGMVTETGFSTNTSHQLFINPNGIVGAIKTNGSATSYITSSDYRLKENVVTDWDATTRLKQLKPSRFNFIADADTTVDGFLAHEVSSIVPEAISGEKDEVDKEGNAEYQGIDQSKLVPLLTKALQEALARIETLEAKVTALEGK